MRRLSKLLKIMAFIFAFVALVLIGGVIYQSMTTEDPSIRDFASMIAPMASCMLALSGSLLSSSKVSKEILKKYTEKLNFFGDRIEPMKDFFESLLSKNPPNFQIVGEDGIGKSTYLKQIFNIINFKKEKKYISVMWSKETERKKKSGKLFFKLKKCFLIKRFYALYYEVFGYDCTEIYEKIETDLKFFKSKKIVLLIDGISDKNTANMFLKEMLNFKDNYKKLKTVIIGLKSELKTHPLKLIPIKPFEIEDIKLLFKKIQGADKKINKTLTDENCNEILKLTKGLPYLVIPILEDINYNSKSDIKNKFEAIISEILDSENSKKLFSLLICTKEVQGGITLEEINAILNTDFSEKQIENNQCIVTVKNSSNNKMSVNNYYLDDYSIEIYRKYLENSFKDIYLKLTNYYVTKNEEYASLYSLKCNAEEKLICENLKIEPPYSLSDYKKNENNLGYRLKLGSFLFEALQESTLNLNRDLTKLILLDYLNLLLHSGCYTEARKLADLKLLSKMDIKLEIDSAILYEKADLLHLETNYDEAIEAFSEIKEYYNSEKNILCHKVEYSLAHCYKHLGQLYNAKDGYIKCIEWFEKNNKDMYLMSLSQILSVLLLSKNLSEFKKYKEMLETEIKKGHHKKEQAFIDTYNPIKMLYENYKKKEKIVPHSIYLNAKKQIDSAIEYYNNYGDRLIYNAKFIKAEILRHCDIYDNQEEIFNLYYCCYDIYKLQNDFNLYTYAFIGLLLLKIKLENNCFKESLKNRLDKLELDKLIDKNIEIANEKKMSLNVTLLKMVKFYINKNSASKEISTNFEIYCKKIKNLEDIITFFEEEYLIVL